jgi:hypothetical protein
MSWEKPQWLWDHAFEFERGRAKPGSHARRETGVVPFVTCFADQYAQPIERERDPLDTHQSRARQADLERRRTKMRPIDAPLLWPAELPVVD